MTTYVHHHGEPPQGLDKTGRRTSRALTEARTVHKRAATALRDLRAGLAYAEDGADPRDTERHTEREWTDRGGEKTVTTWTWRDPDADAIEAALEQTVALLAPFQRTGRPTSGRQDS